MPILELTSWRRKLFVLKNYHGGLFHACLGRCACSAVGAEVDA